MSRLLFPQELEVWYILPAIRKRLALGLIEKGMSQKRIAKLMSITEAAVSQYKKEKRAQDDFLGTKLNAEFAQSSDKILHHQNLFFSEVMKLNNLIKDSGILCDLHKKLVSQELPCDHCELKVCI